MNEPVERRSPTETRRRLEQSAALVYVGAALAMAVVCAAVIISGWFAGVIEDRAERVFWAGAVLGGLGVTALAAAVFPGGDDDERAVRRIRLLLRVGLVAFTVAPALCVGALVADFFWL